MKTRCPLWLPLLAILSSAAALPLSSRAEEIEATEEAPASAEKPKLFFHGLAATSGVTPEEITGLSRFCATELHALERYQVIGDRDVATLMGLEARKQLLGCEEDSSCLAEIAGSIGADRVVYGDVSRYGQTLLLNLTLLDSGDAKAIARVSRQVEQATTLEPLIALLGEALRELASHDPRAKLPVGDPATPGGVSPEVPPTPAPPGSRRRPDPPRRHRARVPYPGLQLRLFVRLDGAGTWHFGSRQTDSGEDEYSTDYTKVTGVPAGGLSLRYQRLDFSVSAGYAGGYWKTPASEYNLGNKPTALWIDLAFAVGRPDQDIRTNIGLGFVSVAGPGLHLFLDIEKPLWISGGKKSAFDLFGRVDLSFIDLSKASTVWSPVGASLILSLGGAFRLTP